MTLPARGSDCRHLQCFDLESFLRSTCSENPGWRCPVCNAPAPLEALEVDQFTWAVLQTPRFADADAVALDAGANVCAVGGAATGIKVRGEGEKKTQTNNHCIPPLVVCKLWKPSWDMYTLRTRFCTFGGYLYAQSVLIDKIPASELIWKYINSALLVGKLLGQRKLYIRMHSICSMLQQKKSSFLFLVHLHTDSVFLVQSPNLDIVILNSY